MRFLKTDLDHVDAMVQAQRQLAADIMGSANDAVRGEGQYGPVSKAVINEPQFATLQAALVAACVPALAKLRGLLQLRSIMAAGIELNGSIDAAVVGEQLTEMLLKEVGRAANPKKSGLIADAYGRFALAALGWDVAWVTDLMVAHEITCQQADKAEAQGYATSRAHIEVQDTEALRQVQIFTARERGIDVDDNITLDALMDKSNHYIEQHRGGAGSSVRANGNAPGANGMPADLLHILGGMGLDPSQARFVDLGDGMSAVEVGLGNSGFAHLESILAGPMGRATAEHRPGR